MAQQPVVILREFSTNDIFPLQTLAPGTYTKKIQVAGNSLLSSVFVKQMPAGATLKVNYFDTTTGTPEIGERFDLTSHDLLTGPISLETNRIIATKIHNKAVCEIIITGAPVEFGVYATVVSAFASDLDSALIRDGDAFVQTTSRALPMACLDTTTNTLDFLRCTDGLLGVTPDVGNPVHLRFQGTTNPGNELTLINYTTTEGKTTKVKTVVCTTNHPGVFKLKKGTTIIASGRCGPGNPNATFSFDPEEKLSGSTLLQLTYTADASPTSGCDIEAYVMLSEI